MPDNNLGFLPTDSSITRPTEDVTVDERELSFRLNLDAYRNDKYSIKKHPSLLILWTTLPIIKQFKVKKDTAGDGLLIDTTKIRACYRYSEMPIQG
jgi:hypothetical protein